MTDDYAELRAALAAGPTPGPWFHGAKNGEHKYCVYDKICWTDESGRHGETPNMVVHVSPDDGRYLEAAYIAAANPEVIRALLDERDALAKDAARYRWLRDGAYYLIEPDRGLGPMIPCGDEMDIAVDAAIDAAMAEREGEK